MSTERARTVAQYYALARSFGPFPAWQCLRLAREQVELERLEEAARPRMAPSLVSYETQPGRDPLRLSFQIKCF